MRVCRESTLPKSVSMKVNTPQIVKRIGTGVLVEQPTISVVIPAYNVAAFIADTLESAFAQTFRDFEVIVVNDGSPDTDQFNEVLAPYLEKIVYVKQPNAGASVARNTGIENARGEYIAFLDGDDIWHPEYLHSQLEFLKSGGFAMVYCDAELFGLSSVAGQTYMDQAPSSGEVDVDALLDLRCNVITSGTLARRHAIEKAGMFETERIQGEDFNLWVRIAHGGDAIGYQREVLLKYRVSPTGFSADSINRVTRSIDVFRRIDRRLDLTGTQRAIIERRITGFESDLAVEKGKAYLIGGNFNAARAAFADANRHRRSPKLAAVGILARIAPKTLLKLFRLRNAGEIVFIPDLDPTASSQ